MGNSVCSALNKTAGVESHHNSTNSAFVKLQVVLLRLSYLNIKIIKVVHNLLATAYWAL